MVGRNGCFRLFRLPMTLLSYLSRPSIRILIGSDPSFRLPKTTVIGDHYYSPQREGYPKDYFWIHTMMAGRLLPEDHQGIICFNDPDILAHILSEVSKIKTDKIISLSYNDNFDWCKCAKCSSERPSDTLIRFVNAVAKTYPKQRFSTLCYQQTQLAPNIRPLPNVQVMLTTITIPKDQTIEFGTRNQPEFRRDLKAWLKLTDNVLVWDYTCNFRHLLMPFPVLHVIGRNIQYYARLGVRQFLIQNNSGIGHEFSELKSNLIAEMMWNPCQDPDKLIESFGSGYYGKAWPYIKEYIALLEVEQRKGKWLINWSDVNEHAYLSEANLLRYYAILFEARKTEPSLRLDTVIAQLDYVTIELGHKDRIAPFRSTCERLGSVTVNQYNLGWKDYLESKGIK